MLWRKEIIVELMSYSKYHIDTRVRLEEEEPWFRVTGIYGASEVNQRFRTWELMNKLHEDASPPWFLGGDFNEILTAGEKLGGGARAPRQMTSFNTALSVCGLTDLGFEGYPFTWSNGREHPHMVRCRLDRVCANPEALTRFPLAYVKHIDHPGSDHLPILLQLDRPTVGREERSRRPFRFEAMWVRKNECEEIIKRVWTRHGGANSALDLMLKGEQCSLELIQWSKDVNPNKEIALTQKRVMELKKFNQTAELRAEIGKLTVKLETLYQDQAMYWRQRGKAAWMKDGDKNTAYFHARATAKKQVNNIKAFVTPWGIGLIRKIRWRQWWGIILEAYSSARAQIRVRLTRSFRCYLLGRRRTQIKPSPNLLPRKR